MAKQMGGLKNLWKIFKNFWLDLLFPLQCLGCGKEGAWICEKCFKNIKIHERSLSGCPECGCRADRAGEFCLLHKKNLDGLWVIGTHEGLLREAIHNFKYKFTEELGEYFSQLVKLFIADYELKKFFTLVVPVPLHARRFAERGYNQSEILASFIADNFFINYEKNILKRKKYTLPQVKLKKEERQNNIRDAFLITKKEQIREKEILLIDDVYTTGATMNECAKVLKVAGAKKVWGLVLARGN